MVITDPVLLKGRDTIAVCRAAVRGGATMVQVRWKDGSPNDVLQLTRSLVAALPVPILVNDRADIALAWTLAHSGAAALLVGMSSARRAAQYRRAAGLVLDREDVAAIAAMLDRRPPVSGDVGDVERRQLLGAIGASYTAPAV